MHIVNTHTSDGLNARGKVLSQVTEKEALRLPLFINVTAPNAFFSSVTVPNSTARLWTTAGVGRRASRGTST